MTNDPAISIRGLGKRYTLGATAGHDTLRDAVMHGARRLLRRAGVGAADDPNAPSLPVHPRLRGRPAGRGDFWALRDVGFDVARGDVIGVIGRNGAGKSTLLKILSGITEPTEGEIRLRGRIASLLEVGTGFHPELTGRENVYLNGAILGMTRAEIRCKFDEIVAFSEVEKFLDTPVKRYSSGMCMRLAFAVAAHLEPEILVIDEVLAVGDAAFQKKCMGKMSAVAGEGRTILFVSHNMTAVSQLCGRAVWLDSGAVRETGPVSKVVQSYLAIVNEPRAERLWSPAEDAPGDDRVRLLAARALQNGEVAPVIDINQPMEIELEFEALRELRNLVAGVSFYDSQGTCLFASADWRPNTFAAGRYAKRVRVTAHTLAEGGVNVLVQLIFFDPHLKSAVVPDALRFEAADGDHELSVRGPYKMSWPGMVRLRLDWGDAAPAERPAEVAP